MFPSEITWDNYLTLFDSISQQHIRLFRGLENSLKAVACTLVIGIPVAAVTAYTLSRMEFRGKKIIKNAILITMVIPVFATIIPLYRMFSAMELLNSTFWLSMVYASSFLPMSIWLCVNIRRQDQGNLKLTPGAQEHNEHTGTYDRIGHRKYDPEKCP